MTKVLVIEDEDFLIEEILTTLQFEGFETLEARNGRQGVALAQQHVPDIVVCDIMMPEMDGYAVLEALRADLKTASIPLIFLTARSSKTDVRIGMGLGADDYLTKPFTRAELLEAIRARVKRREVIAAMERARLEEAQQRLARLVAHELRTPLISISTVQELISRQMNQLEPEDLRDLLEMMNSGSHRLSHVVEQMVFMTQLESGILKQEELMKDGLEIVLWTTLTAAINLAHRFAVRSTDVSIQLDQRSPNLFVKGDPAALKHALAELICNALVYSPDGSQVTIAQWEDDGRAWISITDQGVGISEADWKQAQARFQQVNRERQEQQGMGLGLPLARRLILTHGGTFKLRSEVGKGTQVLLRLPLIPAPRD
jgi:signal transduction histidine kinase